MERTERSWKVSLKLKSVATVGKFWLKFESFNELEKLSLKLESVNALNYHNHELLITYYDLKIISWRSKILKT